MSASLRAGDVVFHAPSGERWLLLAVSSDGKRVHPCGWPSSIAEASDCTLLERRGPDSIGSADYRAQIVAKRVGGDFGDRAEIDAAEAAR